MAFYSALNPIVQLLLALPCLVIILHVYYDGGFSNFLIDLVSFVVDVRRDSLHDTFVLTF